VSALAMWERGVALREAPDRFAPARLADKAFDAKPKESSDLTGGWKMMADQAGWDADQRRTFKEGLSAASSLKEAYMSEAALRNERYSYLLSMLLARKAVAVGFPNGATGDPEIIPTYMFENPKYVNWSTSTVRGNNLNYVAIRVVRLDRSEKLPKRAAPTDSKLAKTVGRRPSSELIDIINTLNNDPAFGKIPRKSQALLVIKNATEKHPKRFPHGKGLSLATVNRYLYQVLGD
jgi:hypothetical protein